MASGPALDTFQGALWPLSRSEAPALSAQADLIATIRDRIIPQLVLAHAQNPPETPLCADTRPPPTSEEVLEFADIAVNQDVSVALAYVENLVRQGVSLEIILLNLIAAAAYRLGEEWEADSRSFADVTLGLVSLQQVVHTLGPTFAPHASGSRGSIVLACPLHEQHTLGLQLLGEFLRRADWQVDVAPTLDADGLVDLVSSEHIDVVGISIKSSDCVEALRDLVREIKNHSLNREILLMVGGDPILEGHAESMGCVYCADAEAAVRWLDEHDKHLAPEAAVNGNEKSVGHA